MFILLTYDVDVTTPSGAKRLRHTAKICEDYGVRIQDSVFELIIDNTQLTVLRNRILSVIDTEKDSVRIYRLAKNYEEKIEVLGRREKIQQDGVLIL